MIYWQLLGVYLKIGIFGFGGGYAMLSLIQYEVVDKYHWLTLQEFTDVVAISQMTPGPIGINSATYIGYTATGSVWGSVIAICLLAIWRHAPNIKRLMNHTESKISLSKKK